MKHFLTTDDMKVKGRTLRFAGEITTEEFTDLKNSINRLLEYRYVKRYLLIVRQNYDDFQKYYWQILQDFKSGKFRSSEERELGWLNSNRLFMNWLTSFRGFIDCVQFHIGNLIPKEEARSIVERLKVKYNDKYFAYRFLYHLRNSAQHVGMPIDQVKIDSGVKIEGVQPEDFSISMVFDTERFLKSYRWNKKYAGLKTEIKSRKIIMVMPVCFEANQCFEEMFLDLKRAIKSVLINDANLILGYKERFNTLEGAPQITTLKKGVFTEQGIHENYLLRFEIAHDLLQD